MRSKKSPAANATGDFNFPTSLIYARALEEEDPAAPFMVLAPPADLALEAVFPFAEELFPFEEEADFPLADADFPLAEADLEVADFGPVDFAPEADFAGEDLLALEADLLVPAAFFAVPADLDALPALEVPAALVAAAFLAPADAGLEAADFVAEAGLEAEDFVPAEAVFLAVAAEADLLEAEAFLVPAALVVADFVPADLDADFVAPEVDFAAVVLLPEAVVFFAVDAGLEAEDLVPLTAFMAFFAASSTAEAALEVIFFADLVTLLTMPELLLAVVFLVEVAISF